jgi:hypothetical protein
MSTAIIGTGGIGSAMARPPARWATSPSSFRATRSAPTDKERSCGSCRRGNHPERSFAGWLPTGARFAMMFGTMSADLFESSSKRSPDPAGFFYVSGPKNQRERLCEADDSEQGSRM